MTIHFEDISLAYGEKVVLDHLSITWPTSGVFVLFGPSGSGKTTLLDVLSGLLIPPSGHVSGLDGLTVARVFQDNRFIPWINCLANVSCVLSPHVLSRLGQDSSLLDALGLSSQPVLNPDNVAQKLLDFVGLGRESMALPAELSGGMLKRLGFARALGYDGDIVVLDEPSVGLDKAAQEDLLDRLIPLWFRKLVVLVTHDEFLAERYGDEIQPVSGPPLTLLSSAE